MNGKSVIYKIFRYTTALTILDIDLLHFSYTADVLCKICNPRAICDNCMIILQSVSISKKIVSVRIVNDRLTEAALSFFCCLFMIFISNANS